MIIWVCIREIMRHLHKRQELVSPGFKQSPSSCLVENRVWGLMEEAGGPGPGEVYDPEES